MKFDIVTVTYNSQKWLEKYFDALETINYDKSQIHLILVDNYSTDETIKIIQQYQSASTLGKVDVIKNDKNLGFGGANNLGAKQGQAPFIFLLNIDTQIDCNVFAELETYISKASKHAVAFECRQSPVEMGKHLNPITLETDWACVACAVIKRQAFEAINGFDEKIDIYANDVDLSWRLRANGGKILYCPKAWVVHHGWQKPDQGQCEYLHSAYGRLLLSYKYGDMKTIFCENKKFLNTLRNPKHFAGVRKSLLKLYFKHFTQIFDFAFWRFQEKQLFQAKVFDFSPGFSPNRGQIYIKQTQKHPLVSVVVRTHKRKEVLKETLKCLLNQTYDNFEVIVIEDGQPTAEKTVKEFENKINIKYHATQTQVGRGKAANIGMDMATGEYICLLDDDDFYYPDYIQTHLAKFEETPQADFILSSIMAFENDVQSIEPYQYTHKKYYPVIFDHITLMDMCVKCRVPLTGGMFKRSLYQLCGGMNEEIDGDEDWYMWLNFFAKGKRANQHQPDICKAVSMFGYPYDKEAAKKREENYAVYDKIMLADPKLVFQVSGAQIKQWETFVYQDIKHLKNIGKLGQFLKDIKPLGTKNIEYELDKTYTLTAMEINNYYYYLIKKYGQENQ